MPSYILGNNRTALLDDFSKPEPAHVVGNRNQWIGNQPGSLFPRPQSQAGVVQDSLHGSSGSGGQTITEKIYGANQRLSARLLQVGADGHEEFNFFIKWNPLVGNYYRLVAYTGSGPTYHIAYAVNGSETSLNSFPGHTYGVGNKISFQWRNGVLSFAENESIIASFTDSHVPGPGKVGFSFYNENATAGSIQADDFMVEEPFGPDGAWAGVGQPLPQLGAYL
jgi:hypothetical protein